MILRSIVDPIPMYARDSSDSRSIIEIPVVGKEIGFDLMKFDWVDPYGKGETSDFIFKVDRDYKVKDDFEVSLTLSFPNPHDGIQLLSNESSEYFNSSYFSFPRHAPISNYAKTIIKRYSCKRVNQYEVKEVKNDNSSANYFFRIRSEIESGKTVKSMFGKIHGDIWFSPRGSDTAKIYFKYYLNPDYTRNLEFDPKRNLFDDLPKSERIGIR